MAITQEFNLNMIPESAPVVVKCDQYDEGTGRLIAHLYNGNVAYTPSSGATVQIQGTKSDKKGFQYNASISGSTVTADLTQQMSAVPGRVRVNIVVNESLNRTGTFVFWLDVQATGLADDVDISETELPDIIDVARRNAARAEAAADAADESAEDSEAWAVGTRNGVAVPSTDETYHNNSKYYAEQAADSASDAADSATAAAASVAQGTQVEFEIIGNDLYVTQTIEGVPQEPQDLGRVVGGGSGGDPATHSDIDEILGGA